MRGNLAILWLGVSIVAIGTAPSFVIPFAALSAMAAVRGLVQIAETE